VFELRQTRKYPLLELLKIAGLAKSTYYDTLKNSKQENKDKWLKNRIIAIYDKHKGRYGYRRITIALNNDIEVQSRYGNVNHKRVKRLMDILCIKAKIRVKKYKSYKGKEGKIAKNIIDRDFSTEKLEQKAVTDVTEFRVNNQKIYLSPLIDLHSKEVLGFSCGKSPSVSFVIEMLEDALPKDEYKALTIHTDQGFQYQNARYQTWLKDKGITQSMSRKGNCYDNAVAENFFSHLKAEFFHVKNFETIDRFTQELKEYIHYYNHERIVTKLKMPPVLYRQHCLSVI